MPKLDWIKSKIDNNINYKLRDLLIKRFAPNEQYINTVIAKNLTVSYDIDDSGNPTIVAIFNIAITSEIIDLYILLSKRTIYLPFCNINEFDNTLDSNIENFISTLKPIIDSIHNQIKRILSILNMLKQFYNFKEDKNKYSAMYKYNLERYGIDIAFDSCDYTDDYIKYTLSFPDSIHKNIEICIKISKPNINNKFDIMVSTEFETNEDNLEKAIKNIINTTHIFS